MLHFVFLALAALTGSRYAIFSNEKSASEGNLHWRGMEVNHQYSKSAEFEQDFGEYVAAEITQDIEVWSLLRGMGELAIVENFSTLTEYHDVFSSCNRNFHIHGSRLAPTDRWCGECPKCAFVFLMLSAYLSSAEVVEIFGADLFARPALLPLFQSLLGYQSDKPFECVGTYDEAVVAAHMALERDDRSERPGFLDWYDLTIIPSLAPGEVKRLRQMATEIQWKQTRIPERLRGGLEKYFDFRRKKR